MRQCKKLPVLMSMLAIALLVVGCGSSPGGSANRSATVPATTATVMPKTTATAANQATAIAIGTTPAGATSVPTGQATSVPVQPSSSTGSVSLILSKTRFAPYEAITVTIRNGLSTSITAGDHQSGCTLVTLQMQTTGGSWQTQALCRQGIASRLITLPAGSSMLQTLQPGAGTFARGASWARGQYRFAFIFSSGVSDPTHELGMNPLPANTVYSQLFVVA